MSLRLARSGIVGISPLRCEPPGITGVYAGTYDDPKFGHARAIASKNLMDVKMCDVTLCYFPKAARNPNVSMGTIVEMAYATALGKPTILVTDDEYMTGHPLIQMCAGWVVPSLEDAAELLEGLLEDYT